MECQCESNEAVEGWWRSGSNVQMGAFALVGYLLYRFSQTLPALIRWPIRIFCSITGLSALWGWVSRLVGTLRGIQSLCKWLSRIWRFMVACSSKFKRVVPVIKAGTSGIGSQTDSSFFGILNLISSTKKPGLRLILLGPRGGGQTSLLDTLCGNSDSRTSMDPLKQSVKQSTAFNVTELTVIDTPDVLGSSMSNYSRAREALRSLQLTSPGPHAFLLVIRAPGSGMGVNQDPNWAIQATIELFGEGVTDYIIPVFTHADRLGRVQTIDQLLEADSGSLKRALSLCGQRAELVDNRSDLPPEEKSVLRRRLVKRVMEMKEEKGYFIHELQKKEDSLRETLLADMSSELAKKLKHM